MKNIQKISEQHTWKAHHEKSTNHSHTGHCAHTLDKCKHKMYKTFIMGNNTVCTTHCIHRTAVTLHTLGAYYVRGGKKT